ncbi:MAG: 30S ribosomal protein S20, partial [Planctomycetia bacterium]
PATAATVVLDFLFVTVLSRVKTGMPHSASAKKRHKQNLRNRERNRAAKSELKSQVRKVLSAIDGGDATQATEALRVLARTADKAAASRKIHRNKAARIKSRLSAPVLAASKGGAAAATTKSDGKTASAKSGGKGAGKSKKSAAKA